MDNANQKINPVDDSIKSEVPKKYLCECIDCIGEWTGYYNNIENLEKDIIQYCRSGKATYTNIE